MKKFKNLAKKTAAWAVLLSMAFSEVTNAFASTQTASANNEEALKSELYVDSSYAAEHPNGVFTFYESKIVANEGDGTAEIKVVRKGGSKGKATVKFKAVDITSVYGTDYTISVGNSLFSKVLDANPNAEHLIDRLLFSAHGSHTSLLNFAPHHVFGLCDGFACHTPTPLVPVFPFPAYAFHMRPHSSVYMRYRNLNLLSIGYVLRPLLRPRLTQSRSALLWKP